LDSILLRNRALSHQPPLYEADRKSVISNAPQVERRWTIAASAALFALVLAAVVVPAARPAGLLRDFDAFYCAGQTLNAGADPYRAEPLGRCERAPKPAPLLSGQAGLAMPAPLPPYALAPFMPLARLPYDAAAILWSLVLAAAVAAAAVSLRRLTGLPLATLGFALLLGDGYASLALGQIAPLAVAGVALAAWLLADGRDELAACAAGLTLLEPHVGIPVCASLVCWRARTRLPLLLIVVACAAASVAIAGAATSLEYVRDVLPAHALSEVANEKQLSLTYALWRLHAPSELALRAGEIWYALATLAALWAAGRIARQAGGGALAAVPAALAVFGGPFVHISQIAAALPAAVLLYARAGTGRRRLLGAAIVALAIPWIQFANLGPIFVSLAALVAVYLTHQLIDARPAPALVAGSLTVLFISAATALVTSVPDVGAALVAHYDARALAEASWARYVGLIGEANATAFDFAKLPTIAALCAVACATLVAALRPMKTKPVQNLAPGGNGASVSRRIA
jgi:hypothetical protein